MKRKILICVLSTLASCSIFENEKLLTSTEIKKEPFNILSYVKNPTKDDSFCIRDIEVAKTDIEKGKIAFIGKTHRAFKKKRYEDELEKLVTNLRLTFSRNGRRFQRSDGTTYGCYEAYMDNYISNTYGENFKDRLIKKADSIYIAKVTSETVNSEPVFYSNCETKPQTPSGITVLRDTVRINSINLIKSVEYPGSSPWMRLLYTIERDSTISEVEVSQFAHINIKNIKYTTPLYEIAMDFLKSEFPVWIPATIDNKPVRTINEAIIYFENL